MTRVPAGWLWKVIATAVVILPILPLPLWTDAPDTGPLWTPHVASWAIGVVSVSVFAVAWAWLAREARGFKMQWHRRYDGPYLAGLALLFAIAAAITASTVFARNPHLVDEMAQLLHARAFAAGRLAVSAPVPQEAFLTAHTWVTNAGWVSQYPPGQTLLFAAGLLLRVEWLVNPVLGAVGVVLTYLVARGLYGRRVARVAAFLWAMSAWVLFMSAGYMNHVGAVTFTLATWAALLYPRRVKAAHAFAATDDGYLLKWDSYDHVKTYCKIAYYFESPAAFDCQTGPQIK